MTKYWFRICFEKEFEDEEDAKNFLNGVSQDILNDWEVHNYSEDYEEKK